MLVLTRKVGEVVVIDGGIEVTVVKIDGGKVRLGFTAPPAVLIHRSEVIQSQREAARRPTGEQAGVV
ncbi:MAG TPA: carbon storage regulator [Gemmataceae bacterium]|nr:carbon storage regulator [Gemmataceae bacterium]